MNSEQSLSVLLMRHHKTREDLNKVSDERKPCIGVSYPELKAFAREIEASDAFAFLSSKHENVYELEILQTYVIGRLKDIDQALFYFDLLARQAFEWSVVDALCQKFVITKKHPKKVLDLLQNYALQHDEYLNRVVAVMLLSHYFQDAYIDEANQLLLTLKHPGYYTKMAVAWAYATMIIRYPNICLDVLETHQLDMWTHNKTIQKIQESFRVSPALKDQVKIMKRK